MDDSGLWWHMLFLLRLRIASLPDALHLLSRSLSCLLSLWEPRASNPIKFSMLDEILRPGLAGVMYPQLSVLVLAI